MDTQEGVMFMSPARKRLTEQAVSELLSADLFDLTVSTIGGRAPTVRMSAPACACIVHTHAWNDPADDR
jgi:hypothetical protein